MREHVCLLSQLDQEGRCILTFHEHFAVFNVRHPSRRTIPNSITLTHRAFVCCTQVYTPNDGPGSRRLGVKLAFLQVGADDGDADDDGKNDGDQSTSALDTFVARAAVHIASHPCSV